MSHLASCLPGVNSYRENSQSELQTTFQ